jgi:hypothetical protein
MEPEPAEPAEGSRIQEGAKKHEIYRVFILILQESVGGVFSVRCGLRGSDLVVHDAPAGPVGLRDLLEVLSASMTVTMAPEIVARGGSTTVALMDPLIACAHLDGHHSSRSSKEPE